MKKKRRNRQLEAEITRFYNRHSTGPIGILDIGKVFAAGEAAHAAGQSVETAVIAACALYCKPEAA